MLCRTIKATIVILVSTFLLCACAGSSGTTMSQSRLTAVQLSYVLSPEVIDAEISLTQDVSSQYPEHYSSMLVEIELDGESIRMLGLTPMGMKIFTLSYSGGVVEKTLSKMVDDDLDPMMILSDFQLAYWPVDSVRQGLSADGYTVSDGGNQRLVSNVQGDLLVEIKYADPDKKWSDVELIHHEVGLTLNVRTLRLEVY